MYPDPVRICNILPESVLPDQEPHPEPADPDPDPYTICILTVN